MNAFKDLLQKTRTAWPRSGAFVILLLIGVSFIAYEQRHDQLSAFIPALTRTTPTTPEGDIDLLRGEWRYLPGSELASGQALRIQPDDFAIAQQDGSGGQPNQPVNLFGTHLEGEGDITLSTTLHGVHGRAGLQFYGKVPLIADEFRIERASIRLSFENTTLTVSRWDGTSQTPTVTTFTFTPQTNGDINVQLTRHDDTVDITVNDSRIGSVAEGGIFDTGTLWFGADASGSAWTLAALAAQNAGDGTWKAVDTSTLHVASDGNGLQRLANKKRPGFLIGAALSLAPAVSDAEYSRVAFGGTFGQLTTENALKWQFVHPQPHTYDFHEADALVALAKAHGLRIHGHTLVFGEANPRWVQELSSTAAADKRAIQNIMTDHIQTVVGHYKGTIATWDVVNEPLADSQTFNAESAATTFRNHLWYKAMGEGYLATAFRVAHQTDPHAQLFMNEYGLEEDGSRWDAFLSLVTRLKRSGVPIDGVGFQAHVYGPGDEINPEVLRTHIRQLASLGLTSRISEMDVHSEGRESLQADQYARVLQMCLSEPTCVSWTTWGVSDRYDFSADDQGGISQGQDLLWDADMQPTPAVQAMQQVLR